MTANIERHENKRKSAMSASDKKEKELIDKIKATESTLKQELLNFKEIKEELRQCHITALDQFDGMIPNSPYPNIAGMF